MIAVSNVFLVHTRQGKYRRIRAATMKTIEDGWYTCLKNERGEVTHAFYRPHVVAREDIVKCGMNEAKDAPLE